MVFSKTEAEQISVTDIDKDRMGQHVSAYKALNVLTLEGRFKDCGLKYDIVRKDEPHKIFVAGDVGGRWGVDVGDTYRIETELSG